MPRGRPVFMTYMRTKEQKHNKEPTRRFLMQGKRKRESRDADAGIEHEYQNKGKKKKNREQRENILVIMQTKSREYHNAQSKRGERRQECELSFGFPGERGEVSRDLRAHPGPRNDPRSMRPGCKSREGRTGGQNHSRGSMRWCRRATQRSPPNRSPSCSQRCCKVEQEYSAVEGR